MLMSFYFLFATDKVHLANGVEIVVLQLPFQPRLHLRLYDDWLLIAVHDQCV